MKKIIVWILVILFLLLGLLFAAPLLLKDRIAEAVKTTINEEVNAVVDFGDVGITIFRNFPDLTLAIYDVSVTGVDSFDGVPLAQIEDIALTVDIWGAYQSGFQSFDLKIIYIDEPMINVRVLESGLANYDIAKPSTDTANAGESEAEASFDIALEQLQIDEANIYYADESGGMEAMIENFNLLMSGDFTESLYLLKTQATIDSLSVRAGEVSYLTKSALQLDAEVEVDNNAQKYTLKDNSLTINELGIELDGFIQMLEDDAMELDLQFNTGQRDFRQLLSMIPAIYRKDFGGLEAHGKISLAGLVKGRMQGESYPAFDLQLDVVNSGFHYPDLPSEINNVNLVAHIENNGGSLDRTIIDIPSMHLEVGDEPIHARLMVKTPMSDPYIDTEVKGKLDLASVPDFYPLEGVSNISGQLVADIAAAGNLSAIEEERYKDFRTSGRIEIDDLIYAEEGGKLDYDVKHLGMKFSPEQVKLENIDLKLGHSDFKANGQLDNFFNYLFAGEVLKGKLNLSSQKLDLNELMAAFAEEESATGASEAGEDTAAAVAAEVPANIDFSLVSSFKEVLYDDLQLDKVAGIVRIADETVSLKNLRAGLFDGQLTINGDYSTKGEGEPKVNLAYDLQKFDIRKTFTYVNSMKALAPIGKYLDGTFSTKLSLNALLDNEMNPILSSLTGGGDARIPFAEVEGLPVLDKVAKIVKLDDIKQLQIVDAFTVFQFKDGRMEVEPFDIKLKKYKINVSGSNGFDQSIDYVMKLDVPADKLGPAKGFVDGLIAKSPIPGIQGIPDVLTFNLGITGQLDNPNVKLLGLGKGQGSGGGGSVKDNLKEVATQAVDAAKDKAKEELDKQKAAAEERLRQESQKLKEEAEKKKKEAEEKAKAEAERLKKEAEKKAKEELKKIFKKPW